MIHSSLTVLTSSLHAAARVAARPWVRAAALTLTGALALGTSAGAVGVSAGTSINNIGRFDYQDDGGITQTTQTLPVTVTVQQVYSVSILQDGVVGAPGQTVYATPGETVTLEYTLTNTGNGPDTVNLSTVGAGGQPLTGAVYYVDDGNGTYGPEDTAVTSVPLAADDQVTIFVRYTLPDPTPAGTNVYIDLIGQSQGDPQATARDSGNYGLISTVEVVSFTFTVNNELTSTTPGTAQGRHVLENTGNGPLDLSTLVAQSNFVSSGASLSGLSARVVMPGGAEFTGATVQEALNLAGSLPVGQQAQIYVSYAVSSGLSEGASITHTLSLYSSQTDTPERDNLVPQSNPLNVWDRVTVIKGAAALVKSVQICADSACLSPISGTNVKPGEFLRYTLTVENTGTADLKFPSLYDYVPAGTQFSSVSATHSGNKALLWGTSRMNIVSSAAPTALATSVDDTQGPWVYLGIDSAADGVVNGSDVLAPGERLTMTLTVKVIDTGLSTP